MEIPIASFPVCKVNEPEKDALVYQGKPILLKYWSKLAQHSDNRQPCHLKNKCNYIPLKLVFFFFTLPCYYLKLSHWLMFKLSISCQAEAVSFFVSGSFFIVT